MANVKRWGWLAAGSAGLLAAAWLLATFAGPTTASSGYQIPTLTPSPIPTATRTPTPNPTATAAAAFFTVDEATMISHYPTGVEFVFRVSSRAGPIQRASVAYWPREGATTSAVLTWDETRGAYVYFDRLRQPPWFQLNYRFRAIDSAGNVFQTADLTQEYADNTRQWLRREDANVIVLLSGGREALIEDLFKSASGAIGRLEEAFGFSLDYKPYVVVMPDGPSFREWQEYADPTLQGVTYQGMGYTAQSLAMGEDTLVKTVVPHELTHIFQGFIAEAWDIPTWFTEGHASYFEVEHFYGRDYEQRVRQWADRLPTLQGDLGMAGAVGPDGNIRWDYDVGYSFIKFWIEHYGWESHRAFWQAQVTMDFQEAMAFATGKSFADLENEWRAYLGAPGPAPTLIPTPTMLPYPTAPPMATLPGAGGGG